MDGAGQATIGLIGAGLIGASFVDAIAKTGADRPVLVLDRNSDNAAATAALHPAGRVVRSIDEMADCDIILVCTPPGTIAGYVRALAAFPATVIDAGSVKGALLDDLNAQGIANPRFVPAHPLSGGVSSGPGEARAAIILSRPVVLTPYEGMDPDALAQAEAFLRQLGAIVLTLDPYAHDRILALLSHLPHLLAYGLVAALEGLGKGEDPAKLRAMLPNSFLTMTRFAESDAEMWRDVFRLNSDAISEAGQKVQDAMAALMGMDAEEGAARLRTLADFRRAVDGGGSKGDAGGKGWPERK